MLNIIIFCIIFFFSCARQPSPPTQDIKIKPEKNRSVQTSFDSERLDPVILPPPKRRSPGLVAETVYSRGYLTDYDICEFLRKNPAETDVLETFGLPDSVWLDDYESTKFLYYFITEMQDYNIIEISTKTDSVSGFEWD